MRTVPVCNLRVGCCGGICAPLAPRAPSPCRQRPSGWPRHRPLPVGPLGARDSARAPRGARRRRCASRPGPPQRPAGVGSELAVESEAPPGMRDGHCQWPAGQAHGHGHGATISSIGLRDSEVQVRGAWPQRPSAHPGVCCAQCTWRVGLCSAVGFVPLKYTKIAP